MMCEYIQKEEDNDVNKHDFVLPLLERQGGGVDCAKAARSDRRWREVNVWQVCM